MDSDQHRQQGIFLIYRRDGSCQTLLFLHAQYADLLLRFLWIFHTAAGIIGNDTQLDHPLEGELQDHDVLLQCFDTQTALSIQSAVLMLDIHIGLEDGFCNLIQRIIIEQRADMTVDIAAEAGIGVQLCVQLHKMLEEIEQPLLKRGHMIKGILTAAIAQDIL